MRTACTCSESLVDHTGSRTPNSRRTELSLRPEEYLSQSEGLKHHLDLSLYLLSLSPLLLTPPTPQPSLPTPPPSFLSHFLLVSHLPLIPSGEAPSTTHCSALALVCSQYPYHTKVRSTHTFPILAHTSVLHMEGGRFLPFKTTCINIHAYHECLMPRDLQP